MRYFFILLLSVSRAEAFAQSVHQATCIRPKGNPEAPVAAIYLHGWFDANAKVNGGFYVDLERSNRNQLQKLADKLGVAIAVPLASGTKSTDDGVMRSWNPSQEPGSAAKKLSAIEKASVAACGKDLKAPRTLIGFSEGGYMVRELALQCAAKSSDYNNVIMIGAKARSGSSKGRKGCAHLVATRGVDDSGANTCVARDARKRCIKTSSFETEATKMIKSIGGGGEIAQAYPGKHIIPPNDILEKFMPPTETASSQFMEDISPAQR